MDSGVERGNQLSFKWLSGKEYLSRRSPTLVENPKAQLDEKQETSRYLNGLNPSYLNELKGINNRLGQTMSQDCRLVIGIPALNEASSLRKTLELYAGQKNKAGSPINPDLFEIHVFHETPAGSTKDNSQEVIEQFKRDYPHIKVHYIYKENGLKDTPSVGRARKYLSDLALLRNNERAKKTGDLILVSNDADAIDIDVHYMTDILEAFDQNPQIDAFTARFRFPESALNKPNVLAAVNFWSLIARLIETGQAENPSNRLKEPVGLVGRNAAMRSSIYAAVGGYNPLARNAEDLELGWLIADSRNWDSQSVSYLNKAKIISNPRRHLMAIATKAPINEMYVDFQKHPEIRTMNNDQLLALIPDGLDLGQLEAEADSWWQSRTKGEYKYLGPRFESAFNRTMRFLGLEFQIVNDHVCITNAEKLVENMSKKYGREVKIIPGTSTKIGGTSWQEEKQVSYASDLTQGLTDVRQAKTREYSNRIAAVLQGTELRDGDKDNIELLKREYERFANKDYGG